MHEDNKNKNTSLKIKKSTKFDFPFPQMLNKIVDSLTEVQDIYFLFVELIFILIIFPNLNFLFFDLPDVFDQIIKEF